MAKQYVTNNHTTALDFPVAGGGFKRVEPNTTENFEMLDPDSKQIQAWRHVSMIFVSDKKPDTDEKASAVASAVVGPTGSEVGAAGGLPQSSSSPTTGKPAEGKV